MRITIARNASNGEDASEDDRKRKAASLMPRPEGVTILKKPIAQAIE